ncbi:MAG TPA: Plug domain-containing protein, partial [Longimicrobiaceae bacterium]|nr:Plug domain-containing protein [Longimicrobiaceae bacterium]
AAGVGGFLLLIFLTRDEIEARRGTNRVTDLLRMMPGVDVVSAGGGMGISRTQLITMRGGANRCLPTIYIDGMPVQQYPESGVDDFLSADMLEGVEVYTSFASAPSPIHSRDGCGVVAFWTRRDFGGKWSWRKMAAGVGGFLLLIFLTR